MQQIEFEPKISDFKICVQIKTKPKKEPENAKKVFLVSKETEIDSKIGQTLKINVNLFSSDEFFKKCRVFVKRGKRNWIPAKFAANEI